MDEYLSYASQFSIGFMFQYAILRREWIFVLISFILLFIGIVHKADSYLDLIAFYVGVIVAIYYLRN